MEAMDFAKIRSAMDRRPSRAMSRDQNPTHSKSQASECKLSRSKSQALIKAIEDETTTAALFKVLQEGNSSGIRTTTDPETGEKIGIRVFRSVHPWYEANIKAGVGGHVTAETGEKVGMRVVQRSLPLDRVDTVIERADRLGDDEVFVAGMLGSYKDGLVCHLRCLHAHGLKQFLGKQSILEEIEKFDGCAGDPAETERHAESLGVVQDSIAKMKRLIKACREQEEFLARTYLLEYELWDMVDDILHYEDVLENCIDFKQKPGKTVHFKSNESEVKLDLRQFTLRFQALIAKVDKELSGSEI